jgi:hypothetical protein
MNFFKKYNLFTLLTKILVIILPFYVIIKVFFTELVWFGFFWFFIKEFILIILFFIVVFEYFKKNLSIKFDLLDYWIICFILYWIWITILNWWWLKEIIFWWRYDFLWFIVFLIYKHWSKLLLINVSDLIKTFLFSAFLSLFLWLMVKFILWEEILQLFWFSIYVADFNFKWGIPIYQWVEASWIRRFQWILDSPLAMWYFLILFAYLFTYINRKNLDFAYNLWLIVLLILIFLTYSRAAMLWFWIWFIFFLIFRFKNLFFRYKKKIFVILTIFVIFIWGLSYVFQDKLYNVFVRHGSTSAHFSRMIIWYNRFLEKPMGSWLASSGPAYRKIINETTLETDKYYIPESWYIQILVEWWVIYFLLYLLITFLIWYRLYLYKNYCIFSMFIWVLIMSLFLHIFEYTYITILLYIFLALFFKWKFAKKT